MAVEVLEGAFVHEAVVLRLARRATVGGERFFEKRVDLFLALHLECQQHLGRLVRVCYFLFREALQARRRVQHGVDRLRDDEARRVVVREARIEGKAERLEKRHRALEVLAEQINENGLWYGTPHPPCHFLRLVSENIAPCGSSAMRIQMPPGTGGGPNISVTPARRTRSAAASMPSTLKY